MEKGRLKLSRDVWFVLVLLTSAIIPFIFLPTDPSERAWAIRGASLLAWILLGGLWAFMRVQHSTVELSTEPVSRDYSWLSLLSWMVTPLLLFALAWLVYWNPLKLHFWGGYDEHVCLKTPDFRTGWLAPPAGRALLFYPFQVLGQTLTPDRFEGFLWIGFALWFLNALLLKGILDCCFPNQRLIGTLAAVLLIADRAEPLRYFVPWSAHAYLRPLFWFLLSTWLLLISWKRNSRGLLMLSTSAMVVSLLTSEGIFPLTLIPLILLRLSPREGRSQIPWFALWGGTLVILAVRLVMFLIREGGRSYQARQLDRLGMEDLVGSLWAKLVTIWHAFPEIGLPSGSDVSRWLPIAVIVMIAMGWTRKWQGRSSSSRPWLKLALGLVLALLAMVLGVLPFLHIPQLYRTQFLAAPARAATLAILCVLLTRALPWKLSTVIPMLLAGIIVGNSAVQSWKEQSAPKPIYFAKTVHVFEQIHGIAPRLQPETALILVVRKKQHSAISSLNYPVRRMSQIVLGVSAGQVNFDDPLNENIRFARTGIYMNCGRKVDQVYSYDQIVAFGMTFEGSLTLLEKLPAHLIPENAESEKYNPRARMMNGSIMPLRWLRHPSWMTPRTDIFEPSHGILLGEGWPDPEGKYGRVIGKRATFFLNPQGRQSVEIELDIEPDPGVSRVGLMDEFGNELASTDKAGRQTLRAQISGKAKHPIKLILQAETGSVVQPRVRTWSIRAR